MFPCISILARGIKFTFVTGDDLLGELLEACCVGSLRNVTKSAAPNLLPLLLPCQSDI
jgi:hypothetical protein